MKAIFSLGIVRGFLAGLAGTAAGIGITAGVRLAMGLSPWRAGANLVIGILVGVVTYLSVVGVFGYWFRVGYGQGANG